MIEYLNVSIVIPHYNNVDGLRRLLSSIKGYPEVIIINDSSDTSELEIIKDLIDDKYQTKVLSNVTGKKGAGSCRNIGIKHASRDWLLFADDDDYFEDGAFEIISRELNYSSNCEFDIVYFSPISRDENGTISDRHLPYQAQVRNVLYENADEQEVRVGFKVPWSKLISKSFVVDNSIYFDCVIASNDIMFSVKSGLLASKIRLLDETIYCVTRNSRSITVNTSRRIMEARLSVAMDYCLFLGRNSKYSSSLVSLIYNYWRFVGWSSRFNLLLFFLKGNLKFAPNSIFNACNKHIDNRFSSLSKYRGKK